MTGLINPHGSAQRADGKHDLTKTRAAKAGPAKAAAGKQAAGKQPGGDQQSGRDQPVKVAVGSSAYYVGLGVTGRGKLVQAAKAARSVAVKPAPVKPGSLKKHSLGFLSVLPAQAVVPESIEVPLRPGHAFSSAETELLVRFAAAAGRLGRSLDVAETARGLRLSLGHAQVTGVATKDAARSPAARGEAALQRVFARHDMLTGEELGRRRGISRQAVDRARQQGRLFAVSGAGRGLRYPAWQIGDTGQPLPRLREVIGLLGGDWATYRFLMSRDAGGQEMWKSLASGNGDMVVSRARARAQGAFD